MTNQEAFDTMVKHLHKQNWVRSVLYSGCAYRGNQGRKCAVGCLIPDDEYKSSLEGQSAGLAAMSCPSLSKISLSLLKDMQRFHDCTLAMNNASKESFREGLLWIAKDHKLDTKVIEEVLCTD